MTHTPAQSLATESVHEIALAALLDVKPDHKINLTNELQRRWCGHELRRDDNGPITRISAPGYPPQLELVAPKKLARRKLSNPKGYAAFIHALCHIEFNAINLALDAVYRFRQLPEEFYTDWIHVAVEEAYHFGLLSAHLQTLGHVYGDFAAHQSLWEVAMDTDHDPLARMALVPRVQEAHGLDVTRGLIEKLRKVNALEGVAILEIILRDEIGHVAIGNHWFYYLCETRNLDPLMAFQALVKQFYRGNLHGPFDLDIRRQAGFREAELAYFQQVNG